MEQLGHKVSHHLIYEEACINEDAWIIRDWIVGQAKICIKGHWATFNGHEVNKSCEQNIFLQFKK